MNVDLTKPAAGPLPLKMLAVLWLVGWTLRVPILAAPPLATRIAETFGLGEAGIGALTMLPVVSIAFGALPAAWVIARFGIRAAVVAGIIVMVVASTARGYVPSASMLFAASVVMGLGVAVFQTALPAATRIWTPSHLALGSAVYLNGMMVGELSGAGLTLPVVMPLAGGDWPTALLLWAIPILAIALLVTLVRTPCAESEAAEAASDCLTLTATLPRWNDLRVWQFGFLLAGSVVTFFVINAFAGVILEARHEAEALEGLLFAYNATPLLASLAVLAAPKWIGARGPIAVSAALAATGLAGFTFLSGWMAWAAALLTGFSATIELILLVSLPATIATGSAVTRLSAGMTLIGFTLAFALSLIGGWLAEAMGRTGLTLVPSLIFAVAVLSVVGRKKRYSRYV